MPSQVHEQKPTKRMLNQIMKIQTKKTLTYPSKNSARIPTTPLLEPTDIRPRRERPLTSPRLLTILKIKRSHAESIITPSTRESRIQIIIMQLYNFQKMEQSL